MLAERCRPIRRQYTPRALRRRPVSPRKAILQGVPHLNIELAGYAGLMPKRNASEADISAIWPADFVAESHQGLLVGEMPLRAESRHGLSAGLCRDQVLHALFFRVR